MIQKEIFNEEGEKILNLIFTDTFNPPHIIFDTLKDKEKEPVIEKFETLEILKEIDFILYAQPISKKETWAKRQKSILHLRPEEISIDDGFKQLIKLPANHYLEVDKANHKIRLIGNFVNKNGIGGWLNF